MTQALRLLGLVAALALLSSCGIFSDKDEELEPKELLDFQQTLDVKKLWSTKVGDSAEFLLTGLRPAGDGNLIYVASRDGNVMALDPATGKSRWKTELGTELSTGPGVAEGAVVVATADGYIVLLDAKTGAQSWRHYIGGEVLAVPVIGSANIVAQTIDNRLQSLSRFDGREQWSLEQSPPALTVRGSASPILIGSTVVAGFDNGRLMAVDIESGDIEWDTLLSLPTGRSDLDRLADIDGAIAVVGQDIYAAGYQGRIASVAAESGQLLWAKEISSNVGAAADWNSVYTARDNGEIVAFSRRNGAESWRNDFLLRREPTLPVPFDSAVVVGDFEGYLHFFSNLNGETVARLRFGKSSISSAPYVIANRLYVQSDDGSVAAFEVVRERPARTAPDVADTTDES